MSNVRKECLNSVSHHLNRRIQSTLDELQAMQSSNADNTKSTAGDKHDTERAMAHMEMENLSKRLENDRRLLHALEQVIKQLPGHDQVREGSIITTDRGIFLIGVACGRVAAGQSFITGISTQSPLGKHIIGKKQGAQVPINGNIFTIQAID